MTVLKNAFKDQFKSAQTDSDIEHEMMNRMQKPNENLRQFFNNMVELNSSKRKIEYKLAGIKNLRKTFSSKPKVSEVSSTEGI